MPCPDVARHRSSNCNEEPNVAGPHRAGKHTTNEVPDVKRQVSAIDGLQESSLLSDRAFSEQPGASGPRIAGNVSNARQSSHASSIQEHGTSDPHAAEQQSAGESTAAERQVTAHSSFQDPELRSVWKNLSLNMNSGHGDILRATDVRSILSGFGRHLKAAALASASFTEMEANDMFGKSWAVTEFEDFMSHSWRDTRVEKVAALCIHYNGKPAVAVSLVAALAVWVLNMTVKLPWFEHPDIQRSLCPWSLLVGNSVLVLATLAWHHLPFWLGGSSRRAVFFDKLCVHQFNPDLKRRGIRSFAAFIARSNSMLLLWSPDYFKRLWCVLELAAMVRVCDCKHGDADEPMHLPVVFLPVRLAVFAVTINLLMSCALLPVVIVDGLGIFHEDPIFRAALPYILIAMGMVPSCHFVRRYMKVRKVLTQQLATFSVESAECFKEADRVIILESIQTWFGSLEAFNEHVRTLVSAQVRRCLGRETHFPIPLLLYSVLPLAFSMLDFAPASLGAAAALRIVARITKFTAVLSTLLLMMHLASWTSCRFSLVWHDLSASVGVGFLLALVLVGEVMAVIFTERFEDIWLAVALLMMSLVWFLFLSCFGAANYGVVDRIKSGSRTFSQSTSSISSRWSI